MPTSKKLSVTMSGMTLPSLGSFVSLRPVDHPDLVAESVYRALAAWPSRDEVAVVEIDPDLADTRAMTAAYAVPLSVSANCVVVAGKRNGQERVAACVVPADARADVNDTVKRLLDVRKASFLPMDRAVAESEMEYGAITPIGLPGQWRLMVDPAVADIAVAIIGSGRRRSKLLLPGAVVAALPRAEVVDGLGVRLTARS